MEQPTTLYLLQRILSTTLYQLYQVAVGSGSIQQLQFVPSINYRINYNYYIMAVARGS